MAKPPFDSSIGAYIFTGGVTIFQGDFITGSSASSSYLTEGDQQVGGNVAYLLEGDQQSGTDRYSLEGSF